MPTRDFLFFDFEPLPDGHGSQTLCDSKGLYPTKNSPPDSIAEPSNGSWQSVQGPPPTPWENLLRSMSDWRTKPTIQGDLHSQRQDRQRRRIFPKLHLQTVSKVQIHSKDTLVLWSNNGNINFWEIENKNPLLEINATNLHNRLSINRHCDIIISGYYKDRPFLINLNEIDFSEDYKTDFVIANTFLSSLNKKYLVSSGTNRRHRLMEIKKHKFFPISVQKRKVADKKEFLTESRYVVLEIWDNAQIDGDTVSLNFNGKWILKDYGLVRGKKQVFLKLEEGQSNELIFYAKNLGKISPNTTAITLIDKKDKKEFEINSNLDENGKITLINTNQANFKNLLD